MKKIITISGWPGSGKSTAARMVASQLGYEHFSSGDLFRMLAQEQGLDLLTASVSAEKDAETDLAVDEKIRQIGENQDNLVIDSRMAWHWIPGSFKVFLDLDFDTAAQRILKSIDARKNANENIPSSAAEYAKILAERFASERRRYKKLYQVDLADMGNYDLIVDTKNNDTQQVAEIINAEFEEWLASGN